jgi:hypothetical protein
MKSRDKQAHTQARWSFRGAAAIAGREHTGFLLLHRRRTEPAKNGTSPRRPPAQHCDQKPARSLHPLHKPSEK